MTALSTLLPWRIVCCQVIASNHRQRVRKSIMTATNEDSPRGLAFAVTAYVMWGFLPLYMKALAHVPPVEVIAHRVVWSIPVAALILLVMRRTADIRAALSSPRTLGMAAVTATLISINWGIYVWAIGSGHALDAALGYYINPLFSVGLGALLLGERPSGAQLFRHRAGGGGGRSADGFSGTGAGCGTGADVQLGLLRIFQKEPSGRSGAGFLSRGAAADTACAGAHPVGGHERSRSFCDGNSAGYVAIAGGGCGDGGAAHRLRHRGKAAAAFDNRHPAIHRTDNDLPDRRLRLRRTVRHGTHDRLSDDLDGPGDLHSFADPSVPSQAYSRNGRA